MYTEYFGLNLKPFNITPDPKFLHLSPGHKEALAHLVYALREHSGFVVITGEVGTGKTTILNAFLLKLPPRMPKVVIKNPNLKPENLYYLLGEAIGLEPHQRSRDNITLYEDRLKQTGGAVLIVDEAQGLSVEMLEEIRLLSNMETPHEKLIQIMLIGQQELNEKLKNPNLRQLKQRIGVKYHIPPLDNDETRDYIDHRLRVAGYEPKEKPLFTVSAIGEIYRITKGFPRLINIICDNALLVTYTDDLKQVSSKTIKKVASELEATYGKGESMPRSLSQGRIPFSHRRSSVALLMAGLLVAVALIAWHLLPQTPATGRPVDPAPAIQRALPPTPETQAVPVKVPAESSPPVVEPEARVPAETRIVLEDAEEAPPAAPVPPVVPPMLQEPARNPGRWLTVRAGDTVAGLAADYYGRVSPQILAAIKDSNPTLSDINLIHEGDRLLLPDIEGSQSVLFSVSVASYHSITEAQAVFSDLLQSGHEATIYPYMDTQGKRWFRITIGTFTSRGAAITFAQQLKGKGFVYARPVKISMEE